AGDDGIFCVDAVKGEKIWNYPGVHVDTKPIVAGGKLYVGSGVGDIHRTTLLLCIDAATGKEVWKVPVDLPAFAPPALAGRPVVAAPTLVGDEGEFGTVRSLYVASTEGRVECLNVENGEPFWALDLTKVSRFPKAGVYAAPTVEVRREGGVERRRIFLAAQF